ncbi:MAG: hypothetical protein JWM65_165 [Sphingomonas bacterium]|nr:hypothetical protein [Sphingomonas bacterium]
MGNAFDRVAVDAWHPVARPVPACGAGHIAQLSLFGIPLTVRSNDAVVLAVLAGICDASPAPVGDSRSLTLSLVVDATLIGSVPSAPHVDGRRMTIDGPSFVAEADAACGRGSCRLSPELRDDLDRLRDAALEPLLLFLVTRRGRTPLHAAGFMVGNLAVLVAGPSGAGKSCLTLAAHRAGFMPLSDDMVFVEEGAAPTVWGLPRPIHVFAQDAPDSDQVIRLRNGKAKRSVALGRQRAPRHAENAVLCLLRFGDAVALERVDPGDALRAFAILEPGFDQLANEIVAAVAALARHGAWSLTLSDRPDEVIALLADSLPLLRGDR